MYWANECTSIEEESGRHRAMIGIKPRAYLRDGSYRAMQFRLGDTGDPVLPFGLDELLAIRFADKLAGQSPIVHVGKGQNHIRMTALDTQNNVAGAVVNDATGIPIGRRYNNAWTGADLEYLAGGHYLRKNVYLKAGHPSVFEFRIDGLAGTLSPSSRGWDLLDDAGRPILWAGAGYLYRPDQPDALTVPVPTTVRVQGGKSIYRYELPAGDWAGWVLEPTWSVQPGADEGKDNWITGNVDPDVNNGSSTAFDYYTSAKRKALMQFTLADLAGKTLTLATLTLYFTAYNAESVTNINRILPANSGWTEAGSTWNHADSSISLAWAGSVGCSTSGTDYSATALHSASYPIPTLPSFKSFGLDLTEFGLMVTSNAGFIISSPTDTQHTGASSDNATAANRPSLSIVYSLSSGGIGRGRNFLARGGRARWP